ncbi:MAG TPA: hypothetical protein VIG99_14105 [Myxococcaceae bacterium]|jgi:hypothetical protein
MPDTTQSQGTQSKGAQGNGADHRGIGERVEHLNQSAHELWSEAQGAVTQLKETLDVRGRVDRNPYGMVLAAVGVGYILGGGLFSRLTGNLVKLGLRVAALPYVKEELLNLAKGAIRSAAEGRDAGPEQPAAPAEPPKTV